MTDDGHCGPAAGAWDRFSSPAPGGGRAASSSLALRTLVGLLLVVLLLGNRAFPVEPVEHIRQFAMNVVKDRDMFRDGPMVERGEALAHVSDGALG
ncbi:hypothetical protein [Salinactinospora qingdaonensis]|uniref:hypothetical protein n=1 Tax=Salinactinospora qingdaonensis TaxID=702744 RepID=UPI003CD0A547